jgi:hypothetical protein
MALDRALVAFAATLDGGRDDVLTQRFCHGGACSLADVHCGPFLFRFDAVLRHYRGYDLAGTHPRVAGVLGALQALPEWDRVLAPPDGAYPAVTQASLVQFYEQYANDMQWGDSSGGKRVLVGRGAVDSAACAL